jgi:hypothetical protein
MNKELRKKIRETGEQALISRYNAYNHIPLPQTAISAYEELSDWVNSHLEPIDSDKVKLVAEIKMANGIIVADADDAKIPYHACPLVFTQGTVSLDIWVGPLDVDSIPRMITFFVKDPADPTRIVPMSNILELFSIAGNNSGYYLYRSRDAIP